MLGWVANGKTDGEIGGIMGVSAHGAQAPGAHLWRAPNPHEHQLCQRQTPTNQHFASLPAFGASADGLHQARARALVVDSSWYLNAL